MSTQSPKKTAVKARKVKSPAKRGLAKPKKSPTKVRKTTVTKKVKRSPYKSKHPKRPITGYIAYLMDNRQRIIKENPGQGFGFPAQVASKEWAKLPQAQKAKYEAVAAKDKERYAKEIASYVPDPRDKKARRHRDPTLPKQASSPYIFFVKAKREQVVKLNPSFSMKDVMRELGRMWRGLSEKDRKPYRDLSAKDKVRYESAMKARESVK